MDDPPIVIQSFVIRLWLEETGAPQQPWRWRGHITYVSSGERRYLRHLDEVISFMTPYLQGYEVELGPRSIGQRLLLRLKGWWRAP